MFLEHTSTEALLFFTLYGITGVVPLIAALYLLLCPGNAFAPDVTPPVRLRRWAASFFAVIALGHVWWMLLYIHSNSFHSVDELLHSVGYAAIVMLDCVAMLTTMVGTLLAMLQDRRRPIWPTFVAIVPFVALGGAFMVWHSEQIMLIAFVYALLLYVLFTAYMVFSVRQYRRWLRDNYADLERKEVWQTHMAVFCFMLIFFLYASIDVDSRALLYLLHIIQLVFFVFLLWRVETLPQLSTSTEKHATHRPKRQLTPLLNWRQTQPSLYRKSRRRPIPSTSTSARSDGC